MTLTAAGITCRPGDPHPDPFLAAKGWVQCPEGCGVWIRTSHSGSGGPGALPAAGLHAGNRA